MGGLQFAYGMTQPPKRPGVDNDSMLKAKSADNGGCVPNKPTRKKRAVWTREETLSLLAGCEKYGVGNWKKILEDPSFCFDNRSAVDLKDRYRSCSRNLKRFFSLGWGEKPPEIAVSQRRRKRLFTASEDDRLLRAFELYGPAWAKIQKDSSFSLSHRKSTDLRDHFRHAFPEKYKAAGLKQHTRKSTPSSMRRVTRVSTVGAQQYSPLRIKEGHYSGQLSSYDDCESLERHVPCLDNTVVLGDMKHTSSSSWHF